MKSKKETSHGKTCEMLDDQPIFLKMAEKELRELYDLSEIKCFDENESVFEPGDESNTILIVFKGKIRITEQIEKSNAIKSIHVKGDWILDLDYAHDGKKRFHGITQMPSTILFLQNTAMESFSPATRFAFGRLMGEQIKNRLKIADQKLFTAERKNRQLSETLFNLRAGEDDAQNQSDLVKQIIKNIPKLPASTTVLIDKLLDIQIPASEASEFVKSDPALTGIVLKTVNSAHFSFRQKIADVHHAIMLLGFNRVYQLIIAESMRRTLPETPVFLEIYQHALAVSHIAFAIAQKTGVGKPAEMGTIGLMHDIGQLIIELLKKKNPKISHLFKALDRAKIGALLLQEWNLPEIVWKSIQYQYYPEFAPPSKVPEGILKNAAIIYFSHISYDLLRGKPLATLPMIYMDAYAPILKLRSESLEEILSEMVMPALAKRMDAMPIALLKLMERALS